MVIGSRWMCKWCPINVILCKPVQSTLGNIILKGYAGQTPEQCAGAQNEVIGSGRSFLAGDDA